MDSDTLTGLLENVARKFPDRRALSVSGKFDLTHARLHDLIERAASRLVSAAGIKPGDVVALTFPNTVEVVFRAFSYIFDFKSFVSGFILRAEESYGNL